MASTDEGVDGAKTGAPEADEVGIDAMSAEPATDTLPLDSVVSELSGFLFNKVAALEGDLLAA